ncbi:MAG: hypothetical protein EAZ79_00860 [Oscillatoriales cyanobacterium]|nr:MAG: hypothetical protein EAZ79_00860 [Oscillatoriales cyanobacterium]
MDVRSPLPQIFLRNWVMPAQVLILFEALLKVEVLCLLSPNTGQCGYLAVARQASLLSGYLTIIPVGADLKLPQQDIKVN